MSESGDRLPSRRDVLKATAGVGLVGAAAPAPKVRVRCERITDAAPWPPRYGHGMVAFRDRLWVIGGTASAKSGAQFNDVWSSTDGVMWRQVTAAAPWCPRWCHATFALGGRLWVIGGLSSVDPITNLNDIWSSPDGRGGGWRSQRPRGGDATCGPPRCTAVG